MVKTEIAAMRHTNDERCNCRRPAADPGIPLLAVHAVLHVPGNVAVPRARRPVLGGGIAARPPLTARGPPWRCTWQAANKHNTPFAVDLAELLSLRVHAGGPGQPPLVANPAVATTTTSPSPAACNIEDENRCHRNSARPEDVPTMLPNTRFLPQCLCDNWPCLGLNRLQPKKQ